MFQSSMGGVFTWETKFQNFYESRGKDIPDEVLCGDCDVGFCGSDVFNEGLLGGKYRPLGFVALGSAGCELVLAKSRDDNDLDGSLRIATSYPLTAQYYCKKMGYDIERISNFGGRIEGKIAGRKYNAIVDIKESGDTLVANNLKVEVVLGKVTMGLVFRKEDYDPNDYVFDEWKLRQILETLMCRQIDLVRGRQPDQRSKNTSLLLSDENRLIKALGEENAELIRAVLRGEGVVTETADTLYSAFVANTRVGATPIAAFNELFRRNLKPTLRLE